MGEKGNIAEVVEATRDAGDRLEDGASTVVRSVTGVATAVVTGVTTDRAVKRFEADDEAADATEAELEGGTTPAP